MLSALSLIMSLLFSLASDWDWRSYPDAGFKILTPVDLSHDVREVPTALSIIQVSSISWWISGGFVGCYGFRR